MSIYDLPAGEKLLQYLRGNQQAQPTNDNVIQTAYNRTRMPRHANNGMVNTQPYGEPMVVQNPTDLQSNTPLSNTGQQDQVNILPITTPTNKENPYQHRYASNPRTRGRLR